jgi:hypothetical protein
VGTYPPPVPGSPRQRSRRRTGLLALACVGLGYLVMMQPLGWNQTAHFALLKSLADGTPRIDRYHWETGDKSYTAGHFFTAKAPGLALLSLPWYELLKAVGGPEAAADVADRRAPSSWSIEAGKLVRSHTRRRPAAAQASVTEVVNRQTPLVWGVALATVLAPALLMLLLVRALAERLEPGLGTAAAVALGLGTMVLPFSTLFFAHVLSAALGFGAFAVLWREREGPARPALVAGAGALAGLAVVVEYPLALIVVVLGAYAASRQPHVRRVIAFGAGAAAGIAPLVVYNLWAFGSIGSLSYGNVVAFPGATGHDRLGLNNTGVFGVGWPRPEAALQLLFSAKGLLVLTPVVLMGVVGTVLLHRRRRAEALTIGAIGLAFLTYNAGYYLPFGGNSPGPRFLVAVLPFLAVPLAIAFRRFTAATTGLALASMTTMAIATVANPQLGTDHTGYWLGRLTAHHLEPTLLTAAVGASGWGAAIPLVAAIGGALVLTALATPALTHVRGQLGAGILTVVAWAAATIAIRFIAGTAVGSSDGAGSPVLIFVAAGFALLGLAVAAVAAPRQAD